MSSMLVTRKQKGFTLIELVMVIVILGILAAFALPRFADLGGEARRSSLEGARGAVKSASAIAHSAWLANDQTGPVVLEGASIDMSTAGYPLANPSTNDGIIEAAQLDANDYTLDNTTDTTELEVTIGTCSFTYDESDGSVSTITDSDTTDDGC
ncbi:type II secretion system protein [Marinobacter lacisalsi]|uniref:Type II secretion system protein n=1 Tax=Marinobacter lacisalsi TaxID=475979 RepID=A0ABV8QF56_9GAMM